MRAASLFVLVLPLLVSCGDSSSGLPADGGGDTAQGNDSGGADTPVDQGDDLGGGTESGGGETGGDMRGGGDGPRDFPAGEPAPPSPGEIRCGMDTCMTPDEVCCIAEGDGGVASDAGGDGGVPRAMCIAKDATCSGRSNACDEPGDCAKGQVCCAHLTAPRSTSCEALADCKGMGNALLCHADSDCPMGTVCCTVGTGMLTVSACRTSCS